MAVANGFGKVVTSGSVFMYDTGDTVNSYRGEPTTNIWGIQTGFDVNQRSGWDMPYAYNGAITDSVYTSGTWNGNRIWEVLHTAGTSGYAGFDSWRLCVNQPTAGNSIYSTTRRVAIKICILEGSITDMALHTGGGNASHDGANWTPIPESQVPRDCPIKTGWYQFLADGSWFSNSVGHCVGLGFISYNRVRILTTEPMYYPSDHLIPFTGYQRSATQGLLPIVGDSSINLSNVSFDSNAQIVFDGTDDFIDTNFPSITLNTPTIEAVVYRSTNTGRYEAIIQNNVVSDDALYVYPNGTLGFWPCAASSLTVPTGQWSYVAVSYDGTNLIYSVNGVTQTITATCADITDWDFLRIGGFGAGDGERWIGKIAVSKVYDRALTANEFNQNYNKYKTRFNLS
jgi:hypothetical protein